MHPGFYYWWKGRGRGGDCGGEHAEGDWGPGGGGWGEGRGERGGWGGRGWGRGHGHGHHHDHHFGGGFDGGGEFGVRRPLRFLAYKLSLGEQQVNQLAKILNDLKTERAQAAVDNRRAVAALADAVAGDAFDEAKAKAAAGDRVKSAEKLRDAVVKALGEIHAILQPGQREQLAYLIRTGALLI